MNVELPSLDGEEYQTACRGVHVLEWVFFAAYPAMSCNDENSTKALRQFANDIGVPAHLRFDMAPGFIRKHTSF